MWFFVSARAQFGCDVPRLLEYLILVALVPRDGRDVDDSDRVCGVWSVEWSVCGVCGRTSVECVARSQNARCCCGCAVASSALRRLSPTPPLLHYLRKPTTSAPRECRRACVRRRVAYRKTVTYTTFLYVRLRTHTVACRMCTPQSALDPRPAVVHVRTTCVCV